MRAVTADSPLWTFREIAQATGGTAEGYFAASGVAFDSREVGAGDLFVALKGEATDGHKFADTAFANGAAGAIVSSPMSHPHVLVPDTIQALEDLARAARARVSAKIIGVTGSVGKTGTKEALFHAFERARPGRTHRSLKSYNNHVGVPLSLSRMPRDTLCGIFEMGMNHAGELAALTRLVRPHVAVVTAIAPAHIEYFGTEAAIAHAKAEIFEGLEPGGTAVIPYDSPHRDLLVDAARQHSANILTFGLGEGADVRAIEFVPAREGGSLVTAKLPEAELCFTISAPGDHWVSNALAVLAAVEAAGGDLAVAGLALAELPGLAGRGERRKLHLKGGDALLIDESYNANPLSMAATLRQLGREPADRRIAVLGAMKELGASSATLHEGLAETIEQAKLGMVILVGDEMAPLAHRLEGGMALTHVANADEARYALESNMRAGDAILIKGSNSIGLSRVVAALTGGEE
ncbi:MAG: UDP-N-acetylmuramoyl-tripeptide--D-alanyl-D-alanine ligase [Sphingobium sp.]